MREMETETWLHPCTYTVLLVLFDWISLRDWVHLITKWWLNLLMFLFVGWVYLWTTWTEMTTRLHVRGKGKERRARVKSAPTPLHPSARGRGNTRKGTLLCVYITEPLALSTLIVIEASVGGCSKAEVCPSCCLFSFRWLWINLTNCKYGSGMWWLKHLTAHYSVLCAAALFFTLHVHVSVTPVRVWGEGLSFMWSNTAMLNCLEEIQCPV